MFIKDIGIDDDGVLRNLDIYQYAVGLQYYTKIPLFDDVLNDCFDELEELIQVFNDRYFLRYGEYPDLSKIIADPANYHMRDIFGCSKLKEMTAFGIPFLKYCSLYKAHKDASRIMHKWSDEGRRLHIITGRKFTSDDNFFLLRNKIRKMYVTRLRKDNIPYDTLTYCTEKNSASEKKEIVQHLNVKAMLEDKVENVISISSIASIICFDATYNQRCQGDNIFRTKEKFIGADAIIQDLEEKEKIKMLEPRRGI